MCQRGLGAYLLLDSVAACGEMKWVWHTITGHRFSLHDNKFSGIMVMVMVVMGMMGRVE